MTDYTTQITAYEAKRAALLGSMEAIMSKAAEEGATLDAAQQEEYDGFSADIEAVDAHLKRLRTMEATVKTVPVAGEGAEEGSASRGGERIVIKTQPKLEPGIGFARLARVKALGRLDNEPAIQVAEKIYGADSGIVAVLKAPVLGGSTADGNWAANLVGDETSVFADFVAFLRPATILGKFGTGGIPSLRKVPFRVALVSQTSGGAGYWVGEGKAKPLTSFGFGRTTLEPLKVANIAVVTEEVLRDSSPSAEAIIRDSLRDALVERLDTDFIDPNKTASANVSPASITNGAESIASTGPDADDIRKDVRSVFAKFIAANNPPTSGVWIMSASTALALSMMVNALGQREFPGIGMNGGTFEGMPAIISEYAGDLLVLVNASDVYLGDEGGIAIDMSREASLEMDSAPSSNSTTPTAAQMVSMFQTNSVALRAERTINWARRRASAVAYLTGVAYGGAVVPS